MLWVLWDIFLPLTAAFLAGLLVGWLLWRWRRSRVDAEALNALRQTVSRLKTDTDNLRIRNAELSDRLQVASGAGRGNPAQDQQELSSARKRIDVLSSELKTSRQQVDQLRKQNSHPDGVNRIRELEAKLKGAQRKIHDFEQSGVIANSAKTDTANEEHAEAIRVRDEMITTLQKSLEQFGKSEDVEGLQADLVLRDRKIQALEEMLNRDNIEKLKS